MLFQTGTKTNTTLPSYPDYVEGPMKDYFGGLSKAGGGMLSGLDGYKGGVAGFNDNIQWGIGKAQDMGHSATRDFSDGILSAGGGYTPSRINPADIAGMMSPYVDRVGASRMRETGRSYDDASAQAGARAANGVAFAGSGSGLALQRAQMERNETMDKDNAMAGILNDAWSQAAGLVSQNAAIDNAAGQFNANQGLSAALGANSAYNDFLARQGTSMDALLNTGNIGRAYQQQLIDLPWNNLAKYGSALQGAPQGTTETTPQYFDPLAIIGGIGAKMFGF